MSFLTALFTSQPQPPELPDPYESKFGPDLPVRGVVTFAPKEDMTAYELALIVARIRLPFPPGFIQLYGPLDARVARHFEPVDELTRAYLNQQRENSSDG